MNAIRVFGLFISFLLATAGKAQSSAYEIKVKLSNYKQDTVFLAYYLFGKTYIKDTGLVKNGSTVFKGNEKLEKGMYLLVQQATNKFVEFLIDDNRQQISIDLDFEHPLDMKVTGSQASSELIAYLKILSAKRPQYDTLLKQLKDAGADDEKKKVIQKQIDAIDTWLKQFRKEYIRKNPASMLSLMIKFNLPYEPPVFSGNDEEKEMKNYRWHKTHWFDNASMADPRMLRTNMLKEKVDYYVDKLTIQHPDSIILSVDEIIDRVKPATETYKFFLIELLNKYARSKTVGMDAVYVHIALKYYATGKAPWTDADQLIKILENARRLEPILIGKKSPDIEMLTPGGEKIRLWNFDAAYTILFFWAYDCSSCKKSVSSLLEVEKQFRDKGVKVFSVCTNTAPGAAEACREFVRNNNMTAFLNTMDPNLESKFKSKYGNVIAPALFILDKNKIIKSKSIEASQVKQVLERLFKEK